MRVRLTCIGDEQVIVDGAAADPPQIGKPFAVLVLSREKLILTGNVAHVGLDTFITDEGTRYSWSREVGDA